MLPKRVGEPSASPRAFLEVARLHVGRAGGRDRGRGHLGHRRDARHRAHPGAHAVDGLDAARHALGERAHASVAAVVEDEDVGHGFAFGGPAFPVL